LLVVSLDAFSRYHGVTRDGAPRSDAAREAHDWERQALVKARPCAGDRELGARVAKIAARVAYGHGAPDPARVHHLRMRMERELAREVPGRFDVKIGYGGVVDVEFAVQWLQMKHGDDPRVHTPDTEAAITALEGSGHLDPHHAAVLREGYAVLRRLEQALRVVHGTSASLIEEGAPGLPALARRMGFRDGAGVVDQPASAALLARHAAVTREVRTTYLAILGLEGPG
jgi:glutamate-ammonia-ligase adenylyltransferase